MSLKTALTAAMNPLFNNRVWWTRPPDAFDHKAGIFLILQQVGGKEHWYYDQPTKPSHEHGRVQFVVQGTNTLLVGEKMAEVTEWLRNSGWVVEPYGAAADDSNEVLKLAISRKDFGIWYPFDP